MTSVLSVVSLAASTQSRYTRFPLDSLPTHTLDKQKKGKEKQKQKQKEENEEEKEAKK